MSTAAVKESPAVLSLELSLELPHTRCPQCKVWSRRPERCPNCGTVKSESARQAIWKCERKRQEHNLVGGANSDYLRVR